MSKENEPARKTNADARDAAEAPAAPIIPEVAPPSADHPESPHDFVHRRMRELREATRKNKED